MFAGLISFEQSISAWGDQDKILTALAPYSLDKPRDRWATDKHLLLQVATRTGSTSADIYQHKESGIAVAFWGRLDNRPDLIGQLEAEHKAPDDELIALAWLKWGEHCPEKLIGDFAFAIVSPRTGVVFLARDVMGVKPLYYRIDENGVFFANSAAAFKPLLLGTLTSSEEWMARFLLELSDSNTDTAYVEIKKLPAAHSLSIHADGRINIRRYHQFVIDAPVENRRDPKYLEAYKAAWQEAVACRIPATGSIGAENSGGLDSGSITAELARQLATDVDRLFAFGCCHGAREPEYIMDTAMKWKLKNNILFSHDISNYCFETAERMMRVYGYPLSYDENIFTSPIYRSCEIHSIGTLFSGHGGDQMVTSSNVQSIRLELIDNKEWLAFWRILSGSFPAKTARFIKNIVISKRSTTPYREGWVQTREAIWRYQFLKNEIITKYNLETSNLAAASYDEGIRNINRLAIKLFEMPYMSERIEACSLEASSFGIDYVWPMLDQRLVQQWLSTPSIWKINDGGLPRYLHRKAVAGISTEKLAWSLNKDLGNYPNVVVKNVKDFRPKLLQMLESLNEKHSPIICLVDMDKAKKIVSNNYDNYWDNIGDEIVKRLKILDLYL